MRNISKILGTAFLAVACCLIFRIEASAAEVTEIKQTAGTEHSVTAQWGAVDGADRYECSLNDGLEVRMIKDIADTKYTFKELDAGKSYLLLVNAYQGDELIAASQEVYELVTSPEVLNLTVTQTDASKTSVSFAASGAAGANHFIVKKTDANGEQLASGASAEVKVTGLKANKKYNYVVYAVRKSANDFYAYSVDHYKKITAKTVSAAVPVKKFDIKGMDFAQDKYRFGLKSPSSYKGDGFELQIRTMKGKVQKTVDSTGMNDITVADMIKGNFYKYRVRIFVNCKSKKAYSKWSEDKYIGVAKNAYGWMSLRKIKITWDKVSGAKSYEISLSTNGKNKDYRVIRTVSSSSKRRVIVTRVRGSRIRLNKKYYFRIRPVSKDGKKTIKSEYTNDVVVILK